MHRRHLHGRMEEDCEAQDPVKILIVWSGALVPAYRQFFAELAAYMRVRALGPRRWVHGSVALGPGSGTGSPASTPPLPLQGPGWECLPVAFWPLGGSRWLVPSLPLQLLKYRPRYLYLMEEPDRPAFLWHALLAKLAWPPVELVSYSLQNLARPAYLRWHHALSLRLSNLLVGRAVAASREAAEALAARGWKGPVETAPLWGSEAIFTPGDPAEARASRRALGIPDDAVLLVFAGSLVEAKGLGLLREVLPRFPKLRLAAAGRGPLEASLKAELGPQFLPLGPLEAEAMARLYRMGDYVILPSVTTPEWKEQIGRSLIEGILCGCTALGSDSGYIPEITLFAEATFKQGDAESLAALLSRLPLADGESIRAAQAANVRERFTAAAVARRTHGILAARRAA